MMGKGDTRRRARTLGAYGRNYDRTFTPPQECPGCGEIELRPAKQHSMWECDNCHLVENRTC